MHEDPTERLPQSDLSQNLLDLQDPDMEVS